MLDFISLLNSVSLSWYRYLGVCLGQTQRYCRHPATIPNLRRKWYGLPTTHGVLFKCSGGSQQGSIAYLYQTQMLTLP